MTEKGVLYLIPTPISDRDPRTVLAPEVIDTILGIGHFIVESERTAGRFLARILPREALANAIFSVLDEHTAKKDIPFLLEPLLNGRTAGLISEAGCPCVADPGSDLVAEAHRRGVRVVPLPGPSSILLALMASGFSGQKFQFLGYIPAESASRKAALRNIEMDCERDGATRIFIETPYRNRALLTDALSVLKEDTLLCVAISLDSEAEHIYSNPVSQWRREKIDLPKEPAIFLMVRGPREGVDKNREPRVQGAKIREGSLARDRAKAARSGRRPFRSKGA